MSLIPPRPTAPYPRVSAGHQPRAGGDVSSANEGLRHDGNQDAPASAEAWQNGGSPSDREGAIGAPTAASTPALRLDEPSPWRLAAPDHWAASGTLGKNGLGRFVWNAIGGSAFATWVGGT